MTREELLKKDIASIVGAIETQDGVYVPLSEVERLLREQYYCKEIAKSNNDKLIHTIHRAIHDK